MSRRRRRQVGLGLWAAGAACIVIELVSTDPLPAFGAAVVFILGFMAVYPR